MKKRFYLLIFGGIVIFLLGMSSTRIYRLPLQGIIIQKLCRNFGKVSNGIYRSGQLSLFQLSFLLEVIHFKTVINIAWNPQDMEDVDELIFCRRRDIMYLSFKFGSSGLDNFAAIDHVIRAMENSLKPVLIHCDGGKDRTGGVIGIWKAKKGYSWKEIQSDWEIHGRPRKGWVQAIQYYYRRQHPLDGFSQTTLWHRMFFLGSVHDLRSRQFAFSDPSPFGGMGVL